MDVSDYFQPDIQVADFNRGRRAVHSSTVEATIRS